MPGTTPTILDRLRDLVHNGASRILIHPGNFIRGIVSRGHPLATALLIMAMTSLVAYLTTFVLGLLLGARVIEFRHFLLAIPVTSIVIFTHAMTMFYLIGCGTRIKEVLKETGIEGEYRADVRALHNTLFLPATLAILATITAFVFGGGADTKTLPPLVHGGTALLALSLNVWTVYAEFQTVIGCVALIDKLGQEIEELEASQPALPQAT